MLKLNFCTLFNTNYISRGLVTYWSLYKVCPDFHLYIFAFDDICAQVLEEMKLDKVTVIRLSAFENEALLRVKQDRTVAEYCWTSTPWTIDFCLEIYALTHCIYIDADLQFFQDPRVLINEVEESGSSVLITKHGYTSDYEHFEGLSGIYCVQFVYFRADKNGKKILTWWKNACLNWCYARYEDGKFGDQKYLDFWPYYFEGVHVLQHRGGGVAPWNIQQFEVTNDKRLDMPTLSEKNNGETLDLIFYHFHNLKLLDSNQIHLGMDYSFSSNVVDLIYKPYIRLLKQAELAIFEINPDIDCHGLVNISQIKEEYSFRDKLYLNRMELGRALRRILRVLNGGFLREHTAVPNLMDYPHE